MAVLVAAAAIAAILVLGGGGGHGNGAPGGAAAGGDVAVSLRGVGDYQDGSPDTHANTAPLATDGDPGTSWYTQTYDSADFGGLLKGLGLVLDAGGPVKLAHVTVATPTPGLVAEIQVGNASTGPFAPDSSSQTLGAKTTFTLDGKSGRYYAVWITRLPAGGKAEISEVTASR